MNDSINDFEALIKLVIIGDMNVGKTNFLIRFIEEQFTPIYQPTVGFDFKSKIVFLPNSKKKVKFQIWDTAGQERYMALNKQLFQSVNGIILMYDITNQQSFERLDEWMKLVKKDSYGVTLILIGNKNDLENKRVISKEKGEEYANKYNIKIFESSGKSGMNVNESFFFLGEQIIRNINKEKRFDDNEIEISEKMSYKNKKRNCC